MDQGIAAVWAGLAGLGGAVVGGGAAVLGSWMTGKKSVEAAERAEQRAAVAEHQHWQRQARYDAYRAFMELIEEAARWQEPVLLRDVMDLATRMREASAGVDILGPDEVIAAAFNAVHAVSTVAFEALGLIGYQQGDAIPADAVAYVRPELSRDLSLTRGEFQVAVREVLGAPPA